MPNLKVTVQAGDITTVKSDLVVVNLFKGVTTPGGATGALDKATGGLLRHFLKAGDFKGDFKDTALLYPEAAPMKRILLVGLGEQEKWTLDRARQVAARVVKRASGMGITRYHTIVHGAGIGGLDPAEAAAAVTEGTLLGAYKFEHYKSKKPQKEGEKKPELAEVVLLEADKGKLPEMKEAVRVATIISESTLFTRTTATLSGDEGTPEEMARIAQEMAREVGLKCTVMDKARIQKEGMNAFLAVNRGSAREPRFVVLEWPGKKGEDTLVFVGKGITFDSGGISLKPGEKMDEMKFDKCGAIAVFGILRACALLKVPQRVIGLTPFTENLPSGTAYKPGDIFTSLNGKTIEILNTDAEGRVILSDALYYADRFKPAAVVDMATLTGAVQIALGNQCSGMMGNNAALLQAIKESAERTHERVWELPFYPEYDELIKAKTGDWANTGGRMAGTITAGRFLEKFIGDYAWAHLDIAATAWQDGAIKYNDEYSPGLATGVGVRLLTDLVRNWKGLPSSKKPEGAKGDAKSVKRTPGKRETGEVEERAVRRTR
ncbi:MAG TPA: leucyl aminopeptidase [Candidatus Thermoplasmatota archaeon]|nr:leucyl aminopeptidase [Candidatus Thermoplasmatota archaeon]